MRAIGEVSVTIDETGKHGHFAKVDDFCIRWNVDSLADFFDFRIANEDDLVGENRSRIRVYKTAGPNRCHLSRREGC